MKRLFVSLMAVWFLVLGTAQCHGSFGLLKTLDRAVSSIGNKWVRWIVFLVLVIIPVYGIAIFVDAIVLNSIEFWTGNKVMSYNENGEAIVTTEKDGSKAVFHYTQFGQQLEISMYKDGALQKQLVLLKDKPGVFFTRTATGLAEIKVEEGVENELKTFTVIEDGKKVQEYRMTPETLKLLELRSAATVEQL